MLPLAIEVIGLIDVGVGLAEIAETSPQLDVGCYHIAGIELHNDVRYLGHGVASGIDFSHIAVGKLNRRFVFLVCGALISKEEVYV